MTRFIEGHHYDRDPLTGCWNWRLNLSSSGYARTKQDGTTAYAHRLAYAETRRIPDGWHVHHTCQNRRCINPVHLAAIPPSVHYATHAEDKGKKLNPEQAVQIRRAWANREPVVALAHRFKVSETTVREIVSGQTWQRAGQAADRAPTVCICCGGPILGDRNSQTQTCSGRCRTRLYRARQATAA